MRVSKASRSQVEYLWTPCSFLEPSGTAVVEAVGSDGGGVVTVVPVRSDALLASLNPFLFISLLSA